MKVVPVTFLPLKLTREIQFAGARGSIPRHGNFFPLCTTFLLSLFKSRKRLRAFELFLLGLPKGFFSGGGVCVVDRRSRLNVPSNKGGE